MDLTSGFSNFSQEVLLFGDEVIRALAVIVFGLIAARYLVKYVQRILPRLTKNVRILSSAGFYVYLAWVVLLVIAALNLLGAEGLVIRRILIAATLILIFFVIIARPYVPSLPFRPGNMVMTCGNLGIISKVSFLTTELRTFDGKLIYIPNQRILGDITINYSQTPHRQVRLKVLIHYKSDLFKAREILTELAAVDPRILDSPPFRVFVTDLAENGVEIAVWAWTKNTDYWRTRL